MDTLNINDNQILDEITQTRNIQKGTRKNYQNAIKLYTESQGKTLTELIQEAEAEEENGVRLKNRTLKKRLIHFRNYLINDKNYSKLTIEKTVSLVKTIYSHYEIEIPKIPVFNNKPAKEYPPIYYDDLPTKELNQEAIRLSNRLMESIILFICSSGCAKAETLSLTIQDFITATSEWHNSTNIYEVLNELKTQDITPESPLFKISDNYFNKKFIELNNLLGNVKKGCFGLIRGHMLRKFHASNLQRGENGLTIEEIDSLQGRTKKQVHDSYFFDDPQELRKKYLANIDKVLIFSDVVTVDTPEVAAIKKRNEELENNIDRIVDEKLHGKIEKILMESGYFDKR